MADEKSLNIVLQGGGVRGIAYVGALRRLPDGVRIRGVGGSSAGAIVAALLAVGKPPSELERILKDPRVYKLLDENDAARTARIETGLRELAQALRNSSALGKARALYSHRGIVADLREVWRVGGLHSSQQIREWLDEILENKTFDEIREEDVEDLRIVAANLNSREFEVYYKRKHGGMKIAAAVQASISIPIFFQPHHDGTSKLVDGGMLSNFPTFLFARSPYPTLGLRLTDVSPPPRVSSTSDLLKAMLLTMTEAHDKHREPPPLFKQHFISVPVSIPATKFALTSTDVDELFSCGLAVGESIRWRDVATSAPLAEVFDPKPFLALKLALGEAAKLSHAVGNQSLWVDELDDEVLLRAVVDRDWSVTYERRADVTVRGKKALFFWRQKLVSSRDDLFLNHGLADVAFKASEIVGDKSRELIRLPAFNTESSKGFVLVVLPPIFETDGTRRFCSTFRIDKEFAATLGNHKPDRVGFQTLRRARDHHLTANFELLVDNSLPALTIHPNFAPSAVHEDNVVEPDGRAYRKYSFSTSRLNVDPNLSLNLDLER